MIRIALSQDRLRTRPIAMIGLIDFWLGANVSQKLLGDIGLFGRLHHVVPPEVTIKPHDGSGRTGIVQCKGNFGCTAPTRAVRGGNDFDHTSRCHGETKTMRHRLRLFTGEDEGTAVAEPGVTVKLSEIREILSEAVRSNSSWLNDFDDDDVQVSADLYEVLSTYWNLRPSA